MSVAQGGSFLQGFAANAVGAAAGYSTSNTPLAGVEGLEGLLARTAIAATAGGAASELTGGKFVNGALTAAIAHIYNQEMSPKGGFQNPETNIPYEMPAHYKAALATIFDVSIDVIDAIEVTQVATTATFANPFIIAVTGVNSVYLRGSAATFVTDPKLILHEYYHVIRQWNAGMTSSDYLNNPPYYENAAKNFAADNYLKFLNLLTKK